MADTKGKTRVLYMGREGMVGHNKTPDWSFLYTTSLTKSSAWNVGDRVDLPDGRRYRYAKSSAACISGQACEFTATGYTAITTVAVAAAVGANSMTVPAATHAALTQDELRGGYAVIYDGTTNNVQFRGIVGNDASILNVAFVIYLDGALTEAITTSSKVETFQNPYAALRTSTSVALGKAGVPAAKVSAASTYFWVQESGPCWVAPQADLANGQIGVYWRHDGSLQGVNTTLGVTLAAYDTSQYAGFTIEGNAAGNGPLLMLK